MSRRIHQAQKVADIKIIQVYTLLNSTQGTRQQSSDNLRNLALSKCEITMLQI